MGRFLPVHTAIILTWQGFSYFPKGASQQYRMVGAPVIEDFKSPKHTALDSASQAIGIQITYDYIRYLGDSLHQDEAGATFIVAHYWVDAGFIKTLTDEEPSKWDCIPTSDVVTDKSLGFLDVDRLAAHKVLQFQCAS